jgi:hypothetical protein
VAATAPPTPESTSSKISVAAGPSVLVVTAMASDRRDSSPPEATGRWRGASRRRGGHQELRAFQSVRGRRRQALQLHLEAPPAMPSSCMAAVTAADRRGAACARARPTCPASLS